MAIKQITPEDAKKRLDDADGSVYIDVRSEPEFAGGHVPGALNIPVFHMDAATRQMRPNPEFVQVAGSVLARDARLIVGCQMGGRSQKACEFLMAAGFSDLSNVRGGFGGARDPFGRVTEPGWLQLNYPVSTEAGEGKSYDSLKARATSGNETS